MSVAEAVILKRLTAADTETMARLANNKKIWDRVRDLFPHPYTLSDAQAFIKRTEEESPAHTFGIVNQENQLYGVIGLVPNDDVYRIGSELGYWIGEPYWGLGIASRAVAQMIQYGFDKLQLQRIYAGVFDFNQASMRVLEKNGFIREGIRRKAVIKNGQIHDEHHYAILRDQYNT